MIGTGQLNSVYGSARARQSSSLCNVRFAWHWVRAAAGPESSPTKSVGIVSFTNEAMKDGFRVVSILRAANIEFGIAGTRGWTISVPVNTASHARQIARSAMKKENLRIILHEDAIRRPPD
jgi:hypothetical protein